MGQALFGPSRLFPPCAMLSVRKLHPTPTDHASTHNCTQLLHSSKNGTAFIWSKTTHAGAPVLNCLWDNDRATSL